MDDYTEIENDSYLSHHGILGMKWGVRRYQNEDGSYTSEGKKRHAKDERESYEGSPTPMKKNGGIDKRKIAIGVGIAVAAVAVGYGLHKSGLAQKGFSALRDVLSNSKDKAVDSIMNTAPSTIDRLMGDAKTVANFTSDTSGASAAVNAAKKASTGVSTSTPLGTVSKIKSSKLGNTASGSSKLASAASEAVTKSMNSSGSSSRAASAAIRSTQSAVAPKVKIAPAASSVSNVSSNIGTTAAKVSTGSGSSRAASAAIRSTQSAVAPKVKIAPSTTASTTVSAARASTGDIGIKLPKSSVTSEDFRQQASKYTDFTANLLRQNGLG